jgi:hypothetical protein
MQRFGKSKWLKVHMLSFVAVLVMFLGGCGGSGGDNTPTWNIAGGWSMFYATKGTPGEQGPNLFTFTTSGNTIGGATFQGQAVSGTLNGLDIQFHFVDTSDGATNTSTGTVAAADGSTMTGTWTKTNGQSGTWHGVIQQSPRVNVTGNWNISQTTSGVAGEQILGLFTFAQSGYSISGTTSDDKVITGAIGLSDISFFWVGSDNVTHTFTATVTSDGKSMSGTWYDTNGKTGTWRATKS